MRESTLLLYYDYYYVVINPVTLFCMLSDAIQYVTNQELFGSVCLHMHTNPADKHRNRLKNNHEFLKIRALEFTPLKQNTSFNVWLGYFVWNFKGWL